MEKYKHDAALLKAGVKFLPWVGKKYEDGFGGTGNRLLILGESHYAWEEGQELKRSITRDLIPGVVRREAWVGNFFYFIEQTVLNLERTAAKSLNGGDFWNSIAFYNFVQSQVEGGARRRPQKTQWIESVGPFDEVLARLKPDRVWVLGKTLWNWLPQGPNDLVRSANLEGYRLSDGHIAWLYGTRHPSSGYSWKSHHAGLSKFIRSSRL